METRPFRKFPNIW